MNIDTDLFLKREQAKNIQDEFEQDHEQEYVEHSGNIKEYIIQELLKNLGYCELDNISCDDVKNIIAGSKNDIGLFPVDRLDVNWENSIDRYRIEIEYNTDVIFINVHDLDEYYMYGSQYSSLGYHVITDQNHWLFKSMNQ